jgi:hypothetical protein
VQPGLDWVNLSGENNLDKLIVGADLKNEKYVDQKKLERLLESCKWMGTGYEFLYLSQKSRSDEYRPGRENVFLGLNQHYEVVDGIKFLVGGKFMREAYSHYRIGLRRGGDTDPIIEFLEKSTEDDEVKRIIFLVPPDLYNFQEYAGYGDVTKEEFDWLLNHPEKAKKVYLVFGAYDMVNKRNFDKDMDTLRGDLQDIDEAGREVKRQAGWRLASQFEKMIGGM